MNMLDGRLLLVALTSLTCIAPLAARADRVPVQDPPWTAPAREAARSNPLENQPSAAAGGHKVFLQRCSTCHGDGGRGTSRGPNLAAADVQSQPDGALFWKVSSGNTHGGMPAFSFLPPAQRWQLVLHLRVLVGASGKP
jgi:mono/diheme cytochrome c family protein